MWIYRKIWYKISIQYKIQIFKKKILELVVSCKGKLNEKFCPPINRSHFIKNILINPIATAANECSNWYLVNIRKKIGIVRPPHAQNERLEARTYFNIACWRSRLLVSPPQSLPQSAIAALLPNAFYFAANIRILCTNMFRKRPSTPAPKLVWCCVCRFCGELGKCEFF